MHSVYALCDPRTGDIRYIGQAVDIYKRYAQHLNYEEYNKPKRAWMNELKSLFLLPSLIVLESNIPGHQILEREMYWIAHYMLQGADLFNIVVPGRAPNGHGTPNPYKAIGNHSIMRKAPVKSTEALASPVEANETQGSRLYTLSEIANRFSLKESLLIRCVRIGELHATKGENGLIFSDADIDSWLDFARQRSDQDVEQRKQKRDSAS